MGRPVNRQSPWRSPFDYSKCVASFVRIRPVAVTLKPKIYTAAIRARCHASSPFVKNIFFYPVPFLIFIKTRYSYTTATRHHYILYTIVNTECNNEKRREFIIRLINIIRYYYYYYYFIYLEGIKYVN